MIDDDFNLNSRTFFRNAARRRANTIYVSSSVSVSAGVAAALPAINRP
jgi:hypothetical protein